jgi:hypothetical protein
MKDGAYQRYQMKSQRGMSNTKISTAVQNYKYEPQRRGKSQEKY